MKRRLLFSTIFSIMTIATTWAQIYFCGAANNWNINEVIELRCNKDGLYYIKIDFSRGTDFKLSTVRPSSGQDGWSEFDSGVMGLESQASVNRWLPLTSGIKTNITAPAAEVYTIYVNTDSGEMMFADSNSDITPADDWSGTLPVLFINTIDNLPVDSKDVYRKATCYLDPMGTEDIQPVGSELEPVTLQIKGRGNYTWIGFDKKPYRLKFDQKTDIMGVKKSKHFALLAHADDNLGFMRNPMGFALSRHLNLPWTPETKPVEVVINDDYIGLYWLTETIRVDKDRVNVIEQADLSTTDVDGGWLIEIDNYDSDPHITVTARDGYNIWFTYKSPEELSTEQSDYLESQMTAINSAVDDGDFSRLAQLVDINCLARYYLVQQLMQDRESFHGSCYLNRQRGDDSRWMFGPVWDFGNAFNDNTGTDPVFIGDANFYQVWIPYIYRMPGFIDAVKNEWSDFVDRGCDEIISELKPIAQSIVAASLADAARWPQYAQTDIMQKYDLISTYLLNSRQWCIDQWKTGAVYDITTDTPDTPVRYFNLQGKQIAHPSPGNLLIRIQGQKADKIIY